MTGAGAASVAAASAALANAGTKPARELTTLAAERTPQAPIILEYVGPDDYRLSLAHVRRAIETMGLHTRTQRAE